MKSFKTFIQEELNENEDFRKKVIGDAIRDYAGNQKTLDGVTLDKIIDAFASKKAYGNKSIDELESELGVSIGLVMRLSKKVKEELKLNYSAKSTGGPSQTQRIDRYLKQKHVGPIRR